MSLLPFSTAKPLPTKVNMAAESNNQKAFLQAAQKGDLVALESFLDSGIDTNYRAPWPNGDDIDGHGAPAIVRASMHGQLSVVKLLIDRGADIDNKNDYPLCDASALLAAVLGGYLEIVEVLVARGAKTEIEVFQGTTTPLAACVGLYPEEFTGKHVEIIKLLLDNGHDIEACDEHGAKPLILAARHGHTDLVKLLLDRGANVNARTSSDERGTSALDEAATDGRLELVRLLLGRGAEIKHKKMGYTALHHAAMNGRVEVMKLLLERGAQPETLETQGTTALHKAAMAGVTSSVKFLLSRGFMIEARSSTAGNTPLLEAADSGATRAVELLLDAGADINARNNQGETALHLATSCLNVQDEVTWGTLRYPRLELIKLLLSRGADLTIVDHDGKSLLQKIVQAVDPPDRPTGANRFTTPKASLRGDIDAVELLLSHGADVNVQDNEGGTVLHRAAHEWNSEMIQMLLDAGADVEAKKSDGSTPLFAPVARGPRSRPVWWITAPAMRVLLDAAANINARKKDGTTVLHSLVVMVRNPGDLEGSEVLALLLERGIDTEVKDSNGETAVQLAGRLGMPFMGELIGNRSHPR